MLKSILISFFILSASSGFSQIDYNDFKKQNPLTCTRTDSASVMQSLKLLDSLSQFEMTAGRDIYLYDYGMTKYVMYAKWDKEEDLKEAIGYFEEGYAMRKISDFAWSLALYRYIGECDKALDYLSQYLKLRKEEGLEINWEQVYYVQKHCCN